MRGKTRWRLLHRVQKAIDFVSLASTESSSAIGLRCLCFAPPASWSGTQSNSPRPVSNPLFFAVPSWGRFLPLHGALYDEPPFGPALQVSRHLRVVRNPLRPSIWVCRQTIQKQKGSWQLRGAAARCSVKTEPMVDRLVSLNCS
jgi:hypothetical protein